jgi:hypothetical protein
MAGRRRENRFLPSTPWSAALQTVEDVMLERSDERDLWVLGETPARRGIHILEVATGGLRLDVQVLHSEPVLVNGGIRHRLHLRIVDNNGDEDIAPVGGREAPGGDDAWRVQAIETAIDRGSPASLVAQVTLLVLDVSNGGCLFESHQPVEPARIGTVRLALNGGWYVEDVQVTRCTAVSGRGATYHIGAQFLRTRRHPDQSLRHVVGQLIGETASVGDAKTGWNVRQNIERH